MILKLNNLFTHDNKPIAPDIAEEHDSFLLYYYPSITTYRPLERKVRLEVLPYPEKNIKITFYLREETSCWGPSNRWKFGTQESNPGFYLFISFPKSVERLLSLVSRV